MTPATKDAIHKKIVEHLTQIHELLSDLSQDELDYNHALLALATMKIVNPEWPASREAFDELFYPHPGASNAQQVNAEILEEFERKFRNLN